MKNHQDGFTLIELAMVLAIIGLLAIGAVAGLGSLRDNAKIQENKQQLKDIENSLLAFVAINNYLPCPALAEDFGKESRNPNNFRCKVLSGELPYTSLQTHKTNPFGKSYSYHINRQALNNSNKLRFESSSYFSSGNCFANTQNNQTTNPPCFELKTHPVNINSAEDLSNYYETGKGNLEIRDETEEVVMSNLPLVVISHGKNSCLADDLGEFESYNCNDSSNNRIFYQAQQTSDISNHFDDLLLGIHSLQVKQAAGLFNNN